MKVTIDKTNNNFLTITLGKNDILEVVSEENTNTYTSVYWKGCKKVWEDASFCIVAEER